MSKHAFFTFLLIILTFLISITKVFSQSEYIPNPSVVSLINEGIELHKQKDYSGAIEAFKEAFSIEPTNVLVRQNLSIAHNNFGKYLAERTDYEKAVSEFRWAIYFDSQNKTAEANLDAVLSQQGVKVKDSLTRLQLGDKLREEANFEHALVEYRKALGLTGEPNQNIYIAIGDIFYILYLREGQKTDDIFEAIEAYEKALSIKETAKAHVKLGDGLLGQRNIVDAIDHYKKALELEPDSIDAISASVRGWNEAVRLAPLVPENHIGLALSLQKKGDFVAAEEEYNQALKLDPNNAAAVQGLELLKTDKLKATASVHIEQALKYQSERKFDEAIKEYVKAIEIAPQDTQLHYNIGTAFQASGDLEHAEKAYRKALKLDKDNEKAQIALNNLKKEIENKKIQGLASRALELQNSENYDGAITTYLAAISLSPQDPQLYYNLGTAYQAAKKYDEAIANYQKALELDKENKTFSEAIKLVKEEVVRPFINSAIQKQTTNDILGAITDYKKALDVLPDDAQTLFNLATAYQSAKQLDNAIKAYLDAAKLDPSGQADSYFFVAVIYEERKNNEFAIKYYNEYLKHAPKGSYAKEAKDLINYLKTL